MFGFDVNEMQDLKFVKMYQRRHSARPSWLNRKLNPSTFSTVFTSRWRLRWTGDYVRFVSDSHRRFRDGATAAWLIHITQRDHSLKLKRLRYTVHLSDKKPWQQVWRHFVRQQQDYECEVSSRYVMCDYVVDNNNNNKIMQLCCLMWRKIGLRHVLTLKNLHIYGNLKR